MHKLNHHSPSSTIHIPLPSSHSFSQSTSWTTTLHPLSSTFFFLLLIPSHNPQVEPQLFILYHPHSSSFFSFLLTIHKLNHNSSSSTIHIPLPSSHSFSQSTSWTTTLHPLPSTFLFLLLIPSNRPQGEPPLSILYYPNSSSFFSFIDMMSNTDNTLL